MMKIMKKIGVWLLAVAMLAAMCGCGSQNDAVNIDIQALGQDLVTKVPFEDELSAVDDTIVKKLYHIEDYTAAVVYIGSGATAEEVAVFSFDSKEAAAAGLAAAQVRIENQKADFESYIPKEVQRLNNAVVKQAGTYVIVCVASGQDAADIIAQYTNK